jgi:hypothetical protein
MSTTNYILTPDGNFLSESELCHHGIKGMKWGVRKYQNEDGSLTPAGKKRYYDTPELNKQKNELKSAQSAYKASRSAYSKAYDQYSMMPTSKNFDNMTKAQSKLELDRIAYQKAKLDYSTNKEAARIQDKGITIKKKSKHRLKLEEQYKKMGMTDEQAQAAANNRIRTEKIITASAALTVAACATYIAVQHRKEMIDGVIKSGETLQRISIQDNGGKLHDVFYVAKGEHDMKRYANLLGATRQKQAGQAFMMKLSAQNDVKVASMDKCRKAFQNLLNNDPDFKRTVEAAVPGLGRMNKKQQYDQFNIALVGMHDSSASRKFYNALKSAGYGALQDVNDMKYSGYHAKNPLIVFDNSNGNIMTKSFTKLTEDLSKKGSIELAKATAETLIEDFSKKAGLLSAGALTISAINTYKTDPNKMYSDSSVVRNYKEKHPGTKMSDREIYEMVNGSN